MDNKKIKKAKTKCLNCNFFSQNTHSITAVLGKSPKIKLKNKIKKNKNKESHMKDHSIVNLKLH